MGLPTRDPSQNTHLEDSFMRFTTALYACCTVAALGAPLSAQSMSKPPKMSSSAMADSQHMSMAPDSSAKAKGMKAKGAKGMKDEKGMKDAKAMKDGKHMTKDDTAAMKHEMKDGGMKESPKAKGGMSMGKDPGMAKHGGMQDSSSMMKKPPV